MESIFKLYRVKHWLHYLGFVFLGLAVSNSISLFYASITIVSSCLLLAYAYSFNDYFDRNKKGLFPFYPVLLLVPFLFFLNRMSLLSAFLFFIVVTFYSMKGIRLKKYPFVVTFLNAAGFSLIFLMASGSVSEALPALLFFLFSFSIIAQLIHELCDFSEDESEGIITTVVYLGRDKTIIFTRIILSLIIVSSLFFNGVYFIFFSIPSIIFSTFFIMKISQSNMKKLRNDFKNHGMIVGVFYLIGILLV